MLFSPDNRWLVTADLRGMPLLWDMASANPAQVSTAARVLRGHSEVRSVAFSPDGRWLATGSTDFTANVWDLRSQGQTSPPIVLAGHQGTVTALAFTRDGRWLVTACGERETKREGGGLSYMAGDQTARLWDLLAADPSRAVTILRGHEDDLTSLDISSNGRWLVTGSRDKTARLWDLTAPNPQMTSIVLNGHSAAITAVAVAADNRSVITWSADGMARRWPIGSDTLRDQARRMVGRNLNQQEWAQYLPGRPYKKTFGELPIHASVIGEVAIVAARSGLRAALDLLVSGLHAEARRAVAEYPSTQQDRLREMATTSVPRQSYGRRVCSTPISTNRCDATSIRSAPARC